MEKILAAEEFFRNKDLPRHYCGGEFGLYYIKTAMIEFAKLHVTAALEKASREAELIKYTDDWGDPAVYLNKASILNAYPLDLIK